ncbi:CbiX/SirB N-terminal domain-containing protein [Roseovarius sp. 2305UL8-3]|uniref:CbiX/SirB N-terminal domain-containing protein n=1 Tax=Roseovarius conchicola TaxID=3121636 RepID=UPI0035284B2E
MPGPDTPTARCAIIVSHGQPSDPDPAEAGLAAFTADVAKALPGWRIESATLAAPGALDTQLEACPPDPLIYPMFMSQGWFTGDNLRKRLGSHPAQLLLPFGVDPHLPDMAAQLLQGVLDKATWSAAETQLFIPGHGSGRSPNSARDTYAFAEALKERIHFGEQRVGFVEQDPSLVDMATGLGPKSICLPFFAARGGHVVDDITEALEKAAFSGIRLDPIGCAPEAPALVARALRRAQVKEAAA